MKRPGHVAFACMLILVGLTASASGAERAKHSGSIVWIAEDARTFVLAEVGPWRVRDGRTVITYQTVRLAPETRFAIVARADDAPSGFPRDFVETRLGPESVYLNDYVTVDCRHEGKRLVAEKITVIEVPAADINGGILR